MKSAITKAVATAAVVGLMVPTLALADNGKHKGWFKHADKDKKEQVDKKHTKADKRHATSTASVATAASIAASGQRIQSSANFLLSLSPMLSARIAAAGTSTAALNAKLAEMTSDANKAKAEAQLAINAAATISTTTSSTTAATVLASAKADIREAQGFLKEARQELFSLIRALWRF